MYIVEKAGKIVKYNVDSGSLDATAFLDISDRVDSTTELRGMYSVAFHPDFLENQKYYVNYSHSTEFDTIVSQFTVGRNSETVLLRLELDSANDHPGGQLAFGPDGYLYISLGDGGNNNAAQDLSVFNGKILRIDVDSGSPYSIPSDNPFVGSGNREEIYAYGFRNPWRISFDSTTGALFVGEVGEGTREEVNIITAGSNYGWPTMEGTQCSNEGCDQSALTLPIYEYSRNPGSAVAIIGGFVYRGSVEEYQGRYIYADMSARELRAIDYDQTNSTFEKHEVISDNAPRFLTTFGRNNANELYFASYYGSIHKLK